jgi:5,10-methylenetetrahydrofolate reductase
MFLSKSKLQQKLFENKFTITAELFPPKGTDIDSIIKKADVLKDLVDAVNITDCQRAIMRTSSLALSKIILDRGLEPVYQITTRDRNVLALQSDILGASVLGIKNILVVSGDYPTIGDHKNAKPVYDVDTIELIKIIKSLENGTDYSGKPLKGNPKFFIGGAVNPNATPIELSCMSVEKKLQAGVDFFQSQPIFDIDQFLLFKKFLNLDKPNILVGVMLLKSYEFANRISQIPGIRIPQVILERLKTAKNELEEGINITVELIRELKKHAQGVHIMAIGIEENIPKILEKI